MRNWIVLVSAVLVLSGCAVRTQHEQNKLVADATFSSKEEMLLKTNNSEKLVEFYKETLKNQESTEVRIKLIKAYLDMKDYESADFHAELVVPNPEQQAEVMFLKAKIDFSQGQIDKAFENAGQALEISPDMPEVENLLGLIWADKGDYEKSRQYFIQARTHFFDDVVIKNNLAVLDLIQKNYQAAADRLLPLYQKGIEDQQVNANLALAYAKLGQYKPLERILKEQKYTSEQIRQIYIVLRQAENHSQTDKAETEQVIEQTDVSEELALVQEDVMPVQNVDESVDLPEKSDSELAVIAFSEFEPEFLTAIPEKSEFSSEPVAIDQEALEAVLAATMAQLKVAETGEEVSVSESLLDYAELHDPELRM